MMRPFGRPPTPSARSIASEPVESVSTFIFALLPSRMIEPSPNCLLIEESASSTFLSRTWEAAGATAPLETLAGAALDMGGAMIQELRGNTAKAVKWETREAAARREASQTSREIPKPTKKGIGAPLKGSCARERCQDLLDG